MTEMDLSPRAPVDPDRSTAARKRKRKRTRRVASSPTPYKKKLGDAELDAILNVR